jgi:sugar-phosphatase
MILAGGGLEGVVPVIVAAGETPRGKPRPIRSRGPSSCCRTAGPAPVAARSVGIEDSHWGLQSARDAGLRTIGLTTSYPASQLEADLILPDVSHVTVDRLEALVGGAVGEGKA